MMANLKEENEALRQELYVAKSKLHVANKTSAELSDELELLAAKWSEELSNAREQHANQMRAQVAIVERLTKELEEQAQQPAPCKPPTAGPGLDQIEAAFRQADEKLHRASQAWEEQERYYQEEIERLQQKLTSTERELSVTVWKNSELKEEVEGLQDQLAAKKGNLQIKAQEVEELRELLAAAQQQNGMLTAEVAGLRSGSNNAQKGNSLFGEVDDQRKRLMAMCTQLKARYYQQKAEHENCPREIQQLRMMRLESQKQYEQCVQLVRAAEYHNVKTLRELNDDLHEQVDRLYRRVGYLENQLAANSAEWVNMLITYHKDEMQKLRQSLITFQHKQRESMELHEDAVKEGWKWRLEAQRLKMKAMNLEVPPPPADLTNDGQPTVAVLEDKNGNSEERKTSVESGIAGCESDNLLSALKERKTPESDVENTVGEAIRPTPGKLPVEAPDAACAMPLQEKSSNVGKHILRPVLVPLKSYKLSDLMVKRVQTKPPETKPDEGEGQ